MRTEQAELTREEIYREWLGLSTAAPTYYGLLGVPELESDENAIQHAARRVKRKLRAYQIGLYRRQALEILAEVGQAVSVLTNPERKRAYDNDLLRKWRKTIEELYQTYCKTEVPEPAALEMWLSACLARGVAVTRLMPRLMRILESRSKAWALLGEAGVPFPICLWIYRDVIILGQCGRVGTLEQRVEAVKQVQKLLGIPEGLVRLMVEEVARGLHLFSKTRIVRQAQQRPEGVLLRLARRIRRFGGHIGPRSKLLIAVAMLLGKHKRDLAHVLEEVDELPVELSAAERAALQARRAKDKVEEAGQRAREAKERARVWVASRPQILVGVAAVLGVAALVAAFLIAAGLWQPFREGALPPGPSPVMAPTPKRPTPADPPPVERPPGAEKDTAQAAPPDGVAPDLVPGLQDILNFIKDRPTGKEPGSAGLESVLPPVKVPELPTKGPPPPVNPPPKDPKNGGSEIKFFGVEGKAATPGDKEKPPDKDKPADKGKPPGKDKPVEVKPIVPEPPAKPM